MMHVSIVLLSLAAAPLGSLAQQWTYTYLPYGDAQPPISPGPYLYDDADRQHVFLMQRSTGASGKSPVLLWAHGNNGTADIGWESRTTLYNAGYSVVSWESVTSVSGPLDGLTCMEDLELVWSWVFDNAELYNFDTTRVVIGGRSRGSICSWEKAHSNDTGIIGYYMYNALPNGTIWQNDDRDPLDEIDLESPPAYLTYGPHCDEPITAACDTFGDIHHPYFGQKVVDRYAELGMQDTIQLTEGLYDNNGNPGDIFRYFPDFLELVDADPVSASPTAAPTPPPTPPPTSDPATCQTALTSLCSDAADTSACFTCALDHYDELVAAGCNSWRVQRMCQALPLSLQSSISTSPSENDAADACAMIENKFKCKMASGCKWNRKTKCTPAYVIFN